MKLALAAQFEHFMSDISALEIHAKNQSQMIDDLADLHNDIMDWAVNTEYERASLEVMAILEQHIQRQRQRMVLSDMTKMSTSDIVVDT